MSVRRTSFATAAVLGLAALSLTACGPDDTTSAGSTASPSVVAGSSAPTGSAAPSVSPSRRPHPSTSPSGKPHPSASPTADCTARAQANTGTVIQLTAAAATGSSLTGQKATFVCGPDVPDDGYWQGTGAAAQYTLAPNAAFELFDSMHPVTVSRQVFLQVASACLTSPDTVQQPHGCFGNMYAVTLGPGNTITSASELFHP